jgi:carboxymethylenebutenolidase
VRRLIPAVCCAAWLVAGLAPFARAAVQADTSHVHLGPANGGTDAFVAWPAGDGPAPGVIVVHEWWGLNAQIREVARRLAKQGYVAIVPDLYHGKVAMDSDPERAHVLMRGLDDEVAVDELSLAAHWLRDQPRTRKARFGVLGFCMGGGLAEELALDHPEALSAVVMFYGPPETSPGKLATLKAPLQGHYGIEDDGIPLAKVEALRSGLAKAGKPAEIYTYTGAGHAFMHEGRDSYRPDAAKQAWARTLAFLQKYLKA